MEAPPRAVTPPPGLLFWRAFSTTLDLSSSGVIMGVLNITPDSFSDGGRFSSPEEAVEQGLKMVDAGAAVLDLGGESTRPGSLSVSEQEELERVLPVLRDLRSKTRALISVDTSKSEVARRALDVGADIINDVTALRGDPKMLDVVAESDCGIVLMHMRGTPKVMQRDPEYDDVTKEVGDFLRERAHVCMDRGIDRERICIDPGFGFGKTFAHNRSLLRGIPSLCALGRPLLIGLSRKAFLGQVTGLNVPRDRLWAGAAVTSFARRAGARIFRVHDVPENLHSLRVTEAILSHA